MKINLTTIEADSTNSYKAYIKTLQENDEAKLEDAFDYFLISIKLSISRQLSSQVEANKKVVVVASSEARDILFLAKSEGEEFSISQFISSVNFDIYLSNEGFITQKFNYKELLERGE